MADRSEAPVETSTESIDDAVSADSGDTDDVTAADLASEAASETGSLSEPKPAETPEPESEQESEPEVPASEAPASETPASETPASDEPASERPKPAAPKPTALTPEEPTPAAEQPEPALPLLRSAPVRHSGDRIADRYRLEECIAQAGIFSSWRAMDEKLRRAVGIHLLASGHQRAKDAVAAARQAALLGDPRFVQVLDAVEDGELVYIIREWLPDAVDLETLLAEGPLETYEAYQMVRQVTDALASAHRRGLSHLRLTPTCVLRSDTGQYRINGIAMDAALHGLAAEDRADAELRDTQAVGELLFAALTHRWPHAEDRFGLQGMPRSMGLVAPEQVRAGVHRGLSDLCAQALCPEPGRHLERLTSPEALAKAITLMPKVRQPDPEPLTIPEYPRPRTAPVSPAPAPAAPATATRQVPGPTRPPAGPPGPARRRANRALKWSFSLVLLAAVGLGSWASAEALLDKHDPTANQTKTQIAAGIQPTPVAQPSPTLLHIAGATEFSPRDEQTIAGATAGLAVDGNPSTSWMITPFFNYPNFGNLPGRSEGSGIVVDLGSVQTVGSVKITLPFGGQTLEVVAAGDTTTTAPTDYSGYIYRLSNLAVATGTTVDTVPLAHPIRTRFVLVHITSLAVDPDVASQHGYYGGISEIQVFS